LASVALVLALAHEGEAARTGNNAAERTVNAVFFKADTNENVHGLTMGPDTEGGK
jgi:hypothetical protein